MRRSEIVKRRSELEAQLDEIKKLESKSNRSIRIKCTSNCYGKGCGRMMAIGSIDYIQVMYYVEPYSCTGGDYWKESEGQFDCKHCGHRNRLYDRKKFELLHRYFKSVVYSHDRVGYPPKIDKRQP